MSRRRIDPGMAKRIAADRIDKLMRLSVTETVNGNKERARRYIRIAIRIGMKTRIPMPKEAWYCKECFIPLLPGRTCTVRLANHKMIIRCMECGSIKRIPYIREQRDDRKRGKEGTHETGA